MKSEITLEEVREAYARFPHIKPLKGGFVRIDDILKKPYAACPLGILAIADGQKVEDNFCSVMDWGFMNYGEYANDFWKGFDGRDRSSTYISSPGYERGREIAIALGL